MSSHENYVKRNLKRRSRFDYKRSSKNLSRTRILDRSSSSFPNFSAEDVENAQNEQGPGENSFEETHQGPSGFAMWGVDPLGLTIDRLQQDKNAPQPINKVENLPATQQPFIRGLTLGTKSKLQPFDILFSGTWSKSADSNTLLLLESQAPVCTGHQLGARLYTVKKPGANRGRRFYSCCYPMDQKCNFFLWAEVRKFDNITLCYPAKSFNRTILP